MDIEQLSEFAKTKITLQSTGLDSCGVVKSLYEINNQVNNLKNYSWSESAGEHNKSSNVVIKAYDISRLREALSASKFDRLSSNRFLDKSKYRLSSKYTLYDYPMAYLTQTQQASYIDYEACFAWIKTFLSEQIGDLIGGARKYRVDNLWHYWTLNDGSPTFNLNSKWHYDSDYAGALKVLVYLNDVSDKNGPFGFLTYENEKPVARFVVGRSGTVVFFRSNLVKHCASNTIESARETFSFTCYPWLGEENVIEDIARRPFNGLASKNPWSLL